jgi:hypothetical protein
VEYSEESLETGPLSSSHLKALFVTYRVARGYTGRPLHITLHVTLDNDIIKVEQQGVELEEDGKEYLDVKFTHEDKELLREINGYDAKEKFVAHFTKAMTLPQLEELIRNCDFKEKYDTHSGDQVNFAQDIFNLLAKDQAVRCDESTTNIQTYILQNKSVVHDSQKDEFFFHVK